MSIYLSDVTKEPTHDDLMNHYELIPANTWGGSLTDCGLKEGYVLYFTTRTLKPTSGVAGMGHRNGSHPRSPGAPLGSPKLATMASIG